MKLKAGNEAEYERRHNEIWPRLTRELRAAGIQDYGIYLEPESLTLFAVQKLTDDNNAAELPHTDIMREWWAYMADLMETHGDNSPVEQDLREVFYME